MKEIEIKENGYTYEMREELKTLRTNIQFCGDDKRVILLTSSVASEGKSTTALNLAISLTELGKKTFEKDRGEYLLFADSVKKVLEDEDHD